MRERESERDSSFIDHMLCVFVSKIILVHFLRNICVRNIYTKSTQYKIAN